MPDEIEPGADQVLARAWPQGAPPVELARLAALPPERVGMVLRRLDALLDSEVADHPPMVDLARRAGLGRAAFFEIRRRWLEQRSLAAIIPFARVPARGAVDRGATQPAAALVADLVRRSPDFVAAGTIARQLMRDVGSGLAFPTALRLVRRERGLAALEPAYLVANYGSVLVVDLCAFAVPVSRPGGTAAAVAALVIERASRLVLAAVAGARDDLIGLQRHALRAAAGMVRDAGVDRADRDRSTLEVVAPDGAEPRLRGSPKAGGVVLEWTAQGDRRFGQRAVALLGSRMGRLQMLPRSTTTGVLGSALSGRSVLPVSEEEAAELIAEAASLHNADILTALRAAAHSGLRLVSDGSIATALLELEI